MELKTHGLSHIHIVVRDLRRSLEFYGTFGFTEASIGVGQIALHEAARVIREIPHAVCRAPSAGCPASRYPYRPPA